jgi:electron transfer flavoprotein alpha subunit
VRICLVDDDPVSLEALAFARRLGDVEAVTIGGEYAPEAWAQAIVELEPEVVVAPGTDRGHEVLAHVAARLDAPLAANCIDARVEGDAFALTRQRWGGSLLEEARLSGSPKLLTVAPHAVAADAAPAEVKELTPRLDEGVRVRIARREEPEVGAVRLDTARVVVGGGRGVGSAEGFAPLEELAGLLGGAVGGSRVVTNLGWRPHADQVGQTGARIAPDLYIACGISGAIQHIVGCKAAKRILVINKDEHAPIVARADYAVVGDLHEIVPALIRELHRAQGVTEPAAGIPDPR